MKRNLLLITALLISYISYAQISTNSEPISSSAANLSINVPVLELARPDMKEVDRQNEEDQKNGKLYKYGVSVMCDIDTENSGKWETLEDGSKVWRLSISIDGALALGLYYDAFWIPSNGELFVYNEDKSQVIGGFTNINNHDSGVFANELIIGNFLTLEYHQKGDSKPIIHINEIAYCYRAIKPLYQARDFGDSDSSCEVNANCSEGDQWENIKKSACRISIKAGNSYGWCSGAMINNTQNDCTPYILTADHCAGGNSGYASESDMNQWVFYFNYEAENCENPNSNPSSNTMSGCSLISNSGNYNIDGTSDFHLVELNSTIPFDYGIYAAGWDASGTGDSQGVSIHHPSGDIKKISTYATSLATTAWSGGGVTHWRVRWVETNNGHGVTEPGSSGSPIFNNEGRIIGDLSGGLSYCYATNSPDYYGKLSYSWESNGGSNNRKLKPFLDPTNSGIEAIDGQACGTSLFSNFYVYDTEIPTNTPINFFYSGTGEPLSYAWTFFGGAANVSISTSTDASPLVQYYTEDSYTVKLKVTDSEGIESIETKQNYIEVDNDFTEINETQELNIQIFPNPSSGTIYISQNANSKSKVRIYSVLGESMLKTEFNTETKQLDLNYLKNGIYFVEISSANGKTVERIILNR